MAIATAADLIDINGNLLTIAEFLAEYQKDLDEAAAGRRFKKFVHTRLDQMGVPANPNPNRTAETGCRIGERLNWIDERLKAARDVGTSRENSGWDPNFDPSSVQ